MGLLNGSKPSGIALALTTGIESLVKMLKNPIFPQA
jgi:hypothetical protein